MDAAMGTRAAGTGTPDDGAQPSAPVVQRSSGTVRVCRDCGVEVSAYRLLCDEHRDLHRILTFAHQMRLIAETSALPRFKVYLAERIREFITDAEALR
jgi:hypothetical protein